MKPDDTAQIEGSFITIDLIIMAIATKLKETYNSAERY